MSKIYRRLICKPVSIFNPSLQIRSALSCEGGLRRVTQCCTKQFAKDSLKTKVDLLYTELLIDKATIHSPLFYTPHLSSLSQIVIYRRISTRLVRLTVHPNCVFDESQHIILFPVTCLSPRRVGGPPLPYRTYSVSLPDCFHLFLLNSVVRSFTLLWLLLRPSEPV